MAASIPSVTFERNAKPASEEKRLSRLENLELGVTDTDHMAIATYSEGKWQTATVVPFANLSMHPASKCFQYGQTKFEGMQAYKTPEGKLVLFRPEKNAKRFNKSGERVEMPELPEALFLEMVETLVWVEQAWIPSGDGGRLYIRPFMFATGRSVRFGVSDEYTFCVLVSPAKAFFSSSVLKVYIEPKLRRASLGGTGSSKCGGNYAAALSSYSTARRHGCHQALFSDGEREKIQECEVTNIFFVGADGPIWTPSLDDDTILEGITRGSVFELGEADGTQVKERDYFVKELLEDLREKRVVEVFLTGTAGGLVAVGSFYHPDVGEITVGDGKMGPVTERLRLELLGIQNGTRPDRFGWLKEVKPIVEEEGIAGVKFMKLQ